MQTTQSSSLSSHVPEETQKHPEKSATASVSETSQAAAPQKQPLSKEEIIGNVRHAPLVEVYTEEIARMSRIVYGSGSALRAETEKILKDPTTKNLIISQVAADPASFHPLAGIQIFGFKTRARRQAEEALFFLRFSIDSYGEAVEYTYKNMGIEIPIEKTEVERDLQKSFNIEKEFSFSDEGTTGIVHRSPSLQRCQKQIYYWSQVVYGNPRILQRSIGDILKNPAIGDQLSWDITVSPKAFHKLAGHSMCSLRNNARKAAERSVLHLSNAVAQYANAVKKEIFSQEKKLQRFSQCSTQLDELNEERIVGLTRGDSDVQRYHARIKYWSAVVYGDSHVLQEQMEDILADPAKGEQVARNIAENPKSIHKFVGRNICGFKDKARVCAESRIEYLCDALKNYTCAVKQAKKSVVQAWETQQKRGSILKDHKPVVTQEHQRTQERQSALQHGVQQPTGKIAKRVAFAI